MLALNTIKDAWVDLFPLLLHQFYLGKEIILIFKTAKFRLSSPSNKKQKGNVQI